MLMFVPQMTLSRPSGSPPSVAATSDVRPEKGAAEEVGLRGSEEGGGEGPLPGARLRAACCCCCWEDEMGRAT
jgi:hypothetical protein